MLRFPLITDSLRKSINSINNISSSCRRKTNLLATNNESRTIKSKEIRTSFRSSSLSVATNSLTNNNTSQNNTNINRIFSQSYHTNSSHLFLSSTNKSLITSSCYLFSNFKPSQTIYIR